MSSASSWNKPQNFTDSQSTGRALYLLRVALIIFWHMREQFEEHDVKIINTVCNIQGWIITSWIKTIKKCINILQLVRYSLKISVKHKSFWTCSCKDISNFSVDIWREGNRRYFLNSSSNSRCLPIKSDYKIILYWSCGNYILYILIYLMEYEYHIKISKIPTLSV